MGSSMISLVILAGIALFLILRLRSVLGTRDGFEGPPASRRAPSPQRKGFEVIDGGGVDRDIADNVDPESDSGKALAAMKVAEPEFGVTDFAAGARQAYEVILMAYETGDLETLQGLLAPDVYASFAEAVEARKAQGLTVEAQFVGVSELKIARASFNTESRDAEISVRYTGELTSAVRDSEGRIVEGDPNAIKRQRDVWTFARKMGSDDPNWLLVATGE